MLSQVIRRSLATALLLFASALTLGACASDDNEGLAALEQRIDGLERQTTSLNKDLREVTRERNRAEAQLQDARRAQESQISTSNYDSIDFDEMCGIPPGDGAFGYTRVSGIDCQTGEAIAGDARRAFCAERNDCLMETDSSDPYVGQIDHDGWDCQVETGWEMVKVACEQGAAVIVLESGS